MGQPIPHGYPDWGRQQSPSDVLLAEQFGRVLTGATLLFSGYVGNAAYIQSFYLGSAANRNRVIFEWFTDASLTNIVGRTTFTMGLSGRFDSSVPIVAPYVTILAEASAYNSTVSYSFAIGVTERSRVGHDVDAPILILMDATAVGAGATVTANATTAKPGLACLSIDTALATWTAKLQFGTLAGVFINMAAMRNGQFMNPSMVALTGAYTRISFTNTTGAAGTVNAYLVAVVDGFG